MDVSEIDVRELSKSVQNLSRSSWLLCVLVVLMLAVIGAQVSTLSRVTEARLSGIEAMIRVLDTRSNNNKTNIRVLEDAEEKRSEREVIEKAR